MEVTSDSNSLVTAYFVLSKRKQVIQVWKKIRLSILWQNVFIYLFLVNYPFKILFFKHKKSPISFF